MLYTVMLFASLCIVETVERSNEIACDTADTVERNIIVVLLTSAAWTGLANDSRIAAAGIAVNRVVYCAVADARFLHAANDLLKSGKILKRIAVKLNIADVSCIGKLVIGSFDLDLFKCADRIINGYME